MADTKTEQDEPLLAEQTTGTRCRLDEIKVERRGVMTTRVVNVRGETIPQCVPPGTGGYDI